jgi:hypothetical protein
MPSFSESVPRVYVPSSFNAPETENFGVSKVTLPTVKGLPSGNVTLPDTLAFFEQPTAQQTTATMTKLQMYLSMLMNVKERTTYQCHCTITNAN